MEQRPPEARHRRNSKNGEQRSSPRNSNSNSNNSHHVHFLKEDNQESAHDSQSAFSHIIGFFTAWIACICGCGLLTLLFMLYFTVRPFSVSAYRRLAAQLGMACVLDALVLLLPTIKIHLTGDSDMPSPVGTSVLVANHLCDGDWWIMFMLGRCVGLQGTMKAMLRNEYLQVDVDGVNRGSGTSSQPGGGSGGNSPSSAGGSRDSPAAAAAAPSNRLVSSNRNNENGNTSGNNHHHSRSQKASPDLSLMARLLHLLLDFPLVNGDDYIADREHLFRLLRSFATGATAPVHLLSFPEAWCVQSQVAARQSILAKSNEFAQREGRPQLKHLLLPRIRGFNASLECLRESNPVVYDVTMAHSGYDGSLAPSEPLSLTTLWDILRRKIPNDIYIRVKRYSLEEVLQDSSWLDKKWHEKDRLLSHFARHGSFPAPTNGRVYCRHRDFDTWSHSLESSLVAISRLLILPCTVPILVLLSIPIFWALILIWMISSIIQRIFPGYDIEQATLSGLYESSSDGNLQSRMTPGSNGSGETASGTPFVPATPFASPTATWFGMNKRD
mmetsp:Transcript_1935/g.5343  ORF Transcript_1935/g.5343 Transcript_1935/m.5343 type:complete len:556 (+) Transcript_1935:136-1803(+)